MHHANWIRNWSKRGSKTHSWSLFLLNCVTNGLAVLTALSICNTDLVVIDAWIVTHWTDGRHLHQRIVFAAFYLLSAGKAATRKVNIIDACLCDSVTLLNFLDVELPQPHLYSSRYTAVTLANISQSLPPSTSASLLLNSPAKTTIRNSITIQY